MPDWDEIVKRAIDEAMSARSGPIPGAVFKQYVEKLGGESPPEKKFINFLKRFEDIITISMCPGSDILIVPNDKVGLLGKEINLEKLRPDLYKAFTTINPSLERFYDPLTDRTVSKNASDSICTSELIAIPGTTEEAEIALRREFISTIQEPDKKQDLAASLEQQVPLSSFSSSLKKHNLFNEWFAFRVKAVMKVARKWADENGLEWRSSWTKAESWVNRGVEVNEGESLLEIANLLKSLKKEDLSRITVPLDVVMTLLRSR